MNKELQFLIYSTPQEDVKIDVVVKDETIWLTQKAMAQLFGVNQPAISKHLGNIFESHELEENSVYSILEYTADDNKQYKTKFYNLDAIISVGYRVNTSKATQFRIWATKTLKEFITKGFVLDDERLKQGTTAFGKDYFRELLERVRSIRTSERRIWQQITDIFAECSIDYDKNSQTTRNFYAMVQNKFHYAITGQTAAEIIYTKADHNNEHMGLTTWKNSPDGRILKSDVTIAKNYLPEDKIKKLERVVSGYFDYIEDVIENENTFTMEQFASSVNEFLSFRKYKILPDKGNISKHLADTKAETEYDTPDNYRRRYNNGELVHKNTFDKRELSAEPKFVRKRRLQAHPEDIDETMSTFGNGNGLKRQEMSTFVNQKTPKLLPVSTIKNINH